MERKLIMEPIKKSDLSELCLGGNILVDSCIGKPPALNVASNISTIPLHRNKRAYARKRGYLKEKTNQKDCHGDDDDDNNNNDEEEEDGGDEEDEEVAEKVAEKEQEQEANEWIRGKGWGMDDDDDIY